MNSDPHPLDPAVDEQASLWAARLDDSPTLPPADRAALDAWLAADPRHRALLASYRQLSADLEDSLPDLVAAGHLAPPPGPAPATPRRRAFAWWTAGAALATTAAVASLAWFLLPARPSETFSTPVAQRRALALPDGSRVELNAHTSLSYAHHRTERRLRLEHGQAYFVVTKDQARPFIVDTPAGSVRVTGTIFDVRTAAGAELDVTVVEGSVQVETSPRAGAGTAASGTTRISLGARDRFTGTAAGGHVQALDAAALDQCLAWRQGQIVFDGVPLSEALARFADYHGRPIAATPPAAGLRLSGRFSLDDLDGFLGSLQQLLPVTTVRDAAGNLQVTLRPGR